MVPLRFPHISNSKYSYFVPVMWKAMGTLNILGVNSPRSLAPFSIGFGFNFNLDHSYLNTETRDLSEKSNSAPCRKQFSKMEVAWS